MSDSGLIPHGFATLVLQDMYREQMDIHAAKAQEAIFLSERLERIVADQKTAAERATSIMETLSHLNKETINAQSQ